MAARIQHYPVVADTGTTPTNYEVIAVSFLPGVVTGMEVHIPTGHAGQTGFSLSYGDAQVVPYLPQAYLSGNHKTYSYDFDDPFPGGSGWFAQVYNRGRYAHTFRLTVELDALEATTLDLPPVILLPLIGAPAGAVPAAPASGLPVPGGGVLVE